MKKNTGIKTLFAAALVTVSLSACHCSANDNTSRAAIPDQNGHHVGNSEISENFSAGSDTNPFNDMYDGIYGNMNPKPESEGGHDHHE
jgi:hypothetical protein